MGWTINGKSPEQLGVTVAGWTDAPLNASQLVLDVVQEDYTADLPAELAKKSSVLLKFDGVQYFKGKVKETPRSANGSSEGINYTIYDAFDELDRTVYMEVRDFVTSVAYTDDFATATTQPYKVGSVLFQDDDQLGYRIYKVLQYAISVGVDLQIGTIAGGIKYFRNEYKDMLCGDVIRSIMRLMPEYVFWLDNTTNPPTANMKLRSAMPALTYGVNDNQLMKLQHTITEQDAGRVNGVVIKYEIPVSIEGKSYTFLKVDSVGATEGIDVVVQTISINGGSHQSEYSRVVTMDLPQEDDDHDDDLKWCISETPELASIADEFGEAGLLGIIKIASIDDADKAVKKHTLTVVDDGAERPPPLNPNPSPLGPATPLTLNATDYPRYITEGSLAEWAGKRFRLVRATATIGVKASDLESVANEGLKNRLKEIFNTPKSFGATEYLTDTFIGEKMGTNAITKNYPRIVTYDLNEPIPVGVAQDLYDQFNQARFSGSWTLKDVEISEVASVGKGINFTGGQAEWATMNEAIQSVTYDIASGETTMVFGSPEQLGANDLKDRLKAAERNGYSHNFQSDQDVKEGVGGTAATPVSNFSRLGGGGGGSVECVLGDLLGDPLNAGKFKIRPGYAIGGGANILLEKVNITAVIGNHLYVEVSWTAAAEDGVLLSGGSMTAAEIKQGSSVPDDDEFTATALAGKHRVALGTWIDDGGDPKWTPAGCGSINVAMCSNTISGSF